MGKKVDVDDLIDANEVAELIGLSHRNAVSLYQGRYDDMPRPIVAKNNGKMLLWLRSEMTAWAKQTGRTKH
jgi:glutathione-regulated potassium-efflux system ancillary protein KefG